MKREVDINSITDGCRYGAEDVVKIGCGDCAGCDKCCHGMGQSIVLDPRDIFELCKGLGKDIAWLLDNRLELAVIDGLILPVMKLQGDGDGCGFLDESGRCSIHDFRPGICRLFPLGRIYRQDEDTFDYVIQIHECPYPNKTKVKIKKWLDIPRLKDYERYIERWHELTSNIRAFARKQDEAAVRSLTTNLLNLFYVMPYDLECDFYEQFYARLDKLIS